MKHHIAWSIVLATTLLCTPLGAHHSFSGTFETSRPRHVEGTVARVEWRNPHTYVHLRVAEATSPEGASRWRIEMSGADVLSRNGWSATTLRPGMEIGIDGFRARDGSNVLGSAAVTVKATGEKLKTPTDWMPPGASR
jgi:hypothetical protein